MLKLSVSAMDSYNKCPKKYHYQYIEKPDIEIPESVHLELGTAAHRALELFHDDLNKNNYGPREYPYLMSKSFKSAVKEGKMHLLKPELPFIKTMLKGYLDKLEKEGMPNVLGVEAPFSFKLKSPITSNMYHMRGLIDRVDLVSPGHYRVVDYKTNKKKKYLTDFQLCVYAYYISNKFKDCKKVSAEYLMLRHNSESISWTFNDADFKDALKKIVDTGDNISNDPKWIKVPTILCNWCDYVSICQNNWTGDS